MSLKKSNSSSKGFRIFAIIALIIGGSFLAFFAVVKFNPSIYRKLFMHASSKTPAQVDPSKASSEKISCAAQDNAEFTTFIDEFQNSLLSNVINTSDSFSLTYDPALYLSMKSDILKDISTQLANFKYESLSRKQQLTYDQLEHALTSEAALAEFPYMTSELSDNFGTPYLIFDILANFSFEDESDVSRYLTFLKNSNTYISNVATYEQARSAQGLYVNDATCDVYISNLENAQKAYSADDIKKAFEKKISALDISSDDLDSYVESNDEYLEGLESEYSQLISTVKSLRGTGKYDLLSQYPGGVDYYKALIETSFGADKTIEQYAEMVDAYIEQVYCDTDNLTRKNSHLTDNLAEYKFPTGEVTQLISSLEKSSSNDFYNVTDVKYTHSTSQSLFVNTTENVFYMTPDLNNLSTNIVATDSTNTNKLYANLAKETYPGKMYRVSQLKTQVYNEEADSIRLMLPVTGYSTGWDQYAKFYSYRYNTENSQDLNNLYMDYEIATILLAAKADIDINYYGATDDTVFNYLTGYGLTSETAEKIISTAKTSPAQQCNEGIGYMEVKEMQRKAQELKGDQYSEAKFNKLMTNLGPLPFSAIEKRLYEM